MPHGYSDYLRKSGYKESTIDEHVRQLQYFFLHIDSRYGKQKELYEILPSDIKQFIAYKKSRQLEITTINKIIAILRRFFDYAWTIDAVAVDPAQKIRYEKLSQGSHEMLDYGTLLSLKEKLIASDTSEKRKIIVILAVHGLRPDEFKITWEQVIINGGTVRIFISKPGHERVIILKGADAETFKSYAANNREAFYVLNSKTRSGEEKPLERMTIGLNLKKAAENHGLDNLTTNVIRRSYAEYLLADESYEHAAEKLGIDKISLMKLITSK
ncbi:tyrosine-type recombinase/integrase [Alkalicoccus halolimnae]|uniref:Site-specific integrase n=1 Tax=Alkalicoccus halolimnae TaxID=1667239 RepID=A0A5C7F964_9BACI|nr:site-specific integrase [Alkalicoccus halolimnae]TXF87251.1 tyrosine-type recombinase/integrase [Alkalicoccus halolimnae]